MTAYINSTVHHIIMRSYCCAKTTTITYCNVAIRSRYFCQFLVPRATSLVQDCQYWHHHHTNLSLSHKTRKVCFYGSAFLKALAYDLKGLSFLLLVLFITFQ